MGLGDYYEGFLDGECRTLGLTRDDLRAWRPAEKGGGRRGGARRAEAAPREDDGESEAEEGAAPRATTGKPGRQRRATGRTPQGEPKPATDVVDARRQTVDPRHALASVANAAFVGIRNPKGEPADTVVALPERMIATASRGLVAACSQLENARDRAVIDASLTKHLSAFGVAVLAAAVASRQFAGKSTRLRPPLDADMALLVREVEFDRFVAGEAMGSQGTLAVRQLRALDPSYSTQVARTIAAEVPGMVEDDAYVVELCLNELLQNVFEWSESPIGCLVLTRCCPLRQSVELAIVDRGVGIPARIRRTLTENLQRETDARVITAAVTRAGLSTRFGRAGGLGFEEHVRAGETGRNGDLTIVSLGAKVAWRGEEQALQKVPLMRGTAIELEFCPLAPIHNPEAYVSVF